MSNRFAITVAVLIGIFNPGWAGAALREVVVSHTDDQGILQLYRMKRTGLTVGNLLFRRLVAGCRVVRRTVKNWLTWNNSRADWHCGWRI